MTVPDDRILNCNDARFCARTLATQRNLICDCASVSAGKLRETRRFVRTHLPAAFLALGLTALGLGSMSCGESPEGDTRDGGGGPTESAIAVAIDAVVQGSISTYYRATASLEASNEADVAARATGVVISIHAEEGDFVEKGQLLLRIDPEEFSLRMKQAESETKKQRSQFDRKQKMFEKNLLSAEDFHTAQNDLEGAEASLALSRLNLSYTRVTAPIGGQIVRRDTGIGRTVALGNSLFAIADLHPLLARVHVPAKEFRELESGQAVELTLDSNRKTLNGVISLISPVIDPSTGTIKVTVEITEYPAHTRPGDFAEVGIVTEEHANSLLVPKIAVVAEKGERTVYVAADSTAERRVVQIGFETDEKTEILSGLAEGERIIIQGQRSLKDGTRIKVLDAIVFEEKAPSPRPS